MSKDRVRIVVIEVSDDDDDKQKGSPRPNAYWQRVREEQEHDAEPDPDTFGGGYRGVKPAPHGGAATVSAEQTLGAEELCWCGLEVGHDWPGKAQGRKHPKEGTAMKVATGTLDRRDLRAYHQRLQDFILQCVNNDGLKFRIARNSLILYPPDGTAPVTVYARNGDRQLRQLQKWYVSHVYDEPDDKGQADPEALAHLAEAMNDPNEHPGKTKTLPPTDERMTPDEQQAELDKARPPVAPEPEREHRPPVEKPTADGKTRLIYGEEAIAWTRMQEALASRESDRDWVTWIRSDNTDSPNIETNGTQYRCKPCLNTDHPFLSERSNSIGGHNRIYHTDTSTLYDKEARTKAVDTMKVTRVRAKVSDAMNILMDALGEESPAARIKELESEKRVLQRENTRLQKELDAKPEVPDQSEELAAATKRADEAEAKLALMREALGL